MQLLLFLSALLTGFTGMIAGERVIEPQQVQRSAASAAVEAFAEVVAPARETVPWPVQPLGLAQVSQPIAKALWASLPADHPVNERRLE